MENWLIAGLLFAVASGLVSSQDCKGKVGVGDANLIKDDAFRASSDDGIHKPHFARLTSDSAWCASPNDTSPSLQVQLPSTHRLVAIAVQGLGGPGDGHYVTKYRISYNYQGATYSYLLDIDGPGDKAGISTQQLDLQTVLANSVIIKPLQFSPAADKPCLKFELYGCPLQAPTTAKPTNPPTTPVDHCKTANGGCQQICTSQTSGPVCRCNNGFILDQDGKTCNVDHCATNNGGCEVTCTSSQDGPVCGCFAGFKLKSDGKNCTNINECQDGTDGCEKDTTYCVDSSGSYKCYCRRGYARKDRYSCVDVDECALQTHMCSHKCINVKGSYRCDCYKGYVLDKNGRTCNDIDECKKNNKCDTTRSTCVNTPGDYKCKCFSGLVNDVNDRFKCVDKNECDYNNGNCDHNCKNSFRSYTCSCRSGFHLASDNHTCNDNNECSNNNAGCAHNCINFAGGYRCTCRTGYNLQSDHHACADINECDRYNGGCEKYCKNTMGSFICSCDPGYEVKNKLCIDIDECATGKHNCDPQTSDCYNLHGSFECRCKQGYKLNLTTKKCEAQLCRSSVAPPTNGIVEPQRCLNTDSNKYGDVCSFKCNAGYKLSSNSASHVFCDSDGYYKQPQGTTSPVCERIRCSPLSGITNGEIYPLDCTTRGIQYGSNCHVTCNGGFASKGITSIHCQQNGTFDASFSQTKCIERPKITCPPDMEETLPLGEGEMLINLGKINTNVAASNLKSTPAGVLDGSYRFKPGYTTVRLVASNDVGATSECSFGVRIIDKEPPKVLDCDVENQYINIGADEAVVTWKEPRFVDNAGLLGKPTVNIDNGLRRRAQVYFVGYTARDTSGNVATCKFFVHVNAKYCDQNLIPGGHNIGSVMDMSPRYFLSCANGNQFSDGSISFYGNGLYGIADCQNGFWKPAEVPSCVGVVAKTGSCPVGTQVISYNPSPAQYCANCPYGHYGNQTDSKCIKCPKGFYQDEEKQSSCKKCPSGSTTVSTGSAAVADCKAVCDKGSYSKDGLMPLNGCTKCPQGSFQDLDGSSHCKICPERGETPGSGTTDESSCYVSARIIKVVPASQEFVGVIGDNVTIECGATGSPSPLLQISNSTVLPPRNLRGQQTILSLPSASKYVTIKRLTIVNAQVEDTATYKCIAQNPTVNGKAVDERTIKVVIRAQNAI